MFDLFAKHNFVSFDANSTKGDNIVLDTHYRIPPTWYVTFWSILDALSFSTWYLCLFLVIETYAYLPRSFGHCFNILTLRNKKTHVSNQVEHIKVIETSMTESTCKDTWCAMNKGTLKFSGPVEVGTYTDASCTHDMDMNWEIKTNTAQRNTLSLVPCTDDINHLNVDERLMDIQMDTISHGIVVFVSSWIGIHDLQFLIFFISNLCIFVCNLNSPMLRDTLKLFSISYHSTTTWEQLYTCLSVCNLYFLWVGTA